MTDDQPALAAGTWSVDAEASHVQFTAVTLAGLVKTPGRFRELSGGLTIERPAVKRACAAARGLLGFDLVRDESRVLDFGRAEAPEHRRARNRLRQRVLVGARRDADRAHPRRRPRTASSAVPIDPPRRWSVFSTLVASGTWSLRTAAYAEAIDGIIEQPRPTPRMSSTTASASQGNEHSGPTFADSRCPRDPTARGRVAPSACSWRWGRRGDSHASRVVGSRVQGAPIGQFDTLEVAVIERETDERG
jgi:hypothetical protein